MNQTSMLYHVAKPDSRASLDRIPFNASDALQSAGRYVISLPAGTVIPLSISLDGPLATTKGDATIAIALEQGVEVEMHNGVPTGFYQSSGTSWRNFNESLWIHAIKFSSQLSAASQPTVQVDVKYSTDRGQ